MSELVIKTLQDYRKQIDEIDDALIPLLARRFAIVKKVGRLKTDEGLEIVQTARVEEVKDRAADIAAEYGFDPEFTRRLYQLIIDYAHDVEGKIKQDLEAQNV